MAGKSFFDVLRDSIHQIVSGGDVKEDSGPQQQRKMAAKADMEHAVIVLATEVMRLRGNASEETETMLFKFLEKNFGKTGVKRRKQVSDHVFVGPQAFTRMACEQLNALTTNESKLEIIKLLYSIASADDFITGKEHSTIQKIAGYLHIPSDELKSIKERYVRVNNPFAILEMDETIIISDVKAAYRKMVLRYHPDKRKDKVDTAEANRKFREIKRAYEQILRQLRD